MLKLFKRELLFALIVALLLGGYLGVGEWLAPEVPAEINTPISKVVSWEQFRKEAQEGVNQRKRRNAAIVERAQFLKTWYQWGAGVGLVLFLAYTFWRPPGVADPSQAKTGKPTGTALAPKMFAGQLSRRAVVMMLGTLMLLVIIIVVTVAILNR